MRFSLKKALGSPFGLGLPILAFFIGLPTMCFFFIATQWETLNLNLFLLTIGTIYVISYIVTFGYMAAGGNRFIYNLKPTLPPLNLQLLKIGLKGLVFAFNTFILLLALWLIIRLFFYALFSITTHAALIFLIVPLMIAGMLCYAFYMMAAWARFMDTYRPSLVFKFFSNFVFIKRYWTKLLRVILFVTGVGVILFIPLLFILAASEVLLKVNTQFIYAYIYVKALIQAYLLLVNVNVLAQAYAWIKKDHDGDLQAASALSVIQNGESDEEDPVIMKDIIVISDLNQTAKKVSNAKTLAKTTAKTKTVTKPKAQSASTGKKMSAKNKKS